MLIRPTALAFALGLVSANIWASMHLPDMGIVTAAQRHCKHPERIILLTGAGGLVVARVVSGRFGMDDQVAGRLRHLGTQDVLVNGRVGTITIEDVAASRHRAHELCFRIAQ